MKTKQRNLILLLFTLILAGLGLGLWISLVSANSGTISGTVVDSQGPLAGARVRVRATENMTLTDQSGAFILTGLTAGQGVEAPLQSMCLHWRGSKDSPNLAS